MYVSEIDRILKTLPPPDIPHPLVPGPVSMRSCHSHDCVMPYGTADLERGHYLGSPL